MQYIFQVCIFFSDPYGAVNSEAIAIYIYQETWTVLCDPIRSGSVQLDNLYISMAIQYTFFTSYLGRFF